MPAPRLIVRREAVDQLSHESVEAMWQLYRRYYQHVERRVFKRDLREKPIVFTARDATGRLVGFSTAILYPHTHEGRTAGVCFSGDTMLEPAWWGRGDLHRAVAAWLLGWKLRHPGRPLYWFLVCHGCRTYLTMVRYFPTHWPRHDRATPPWERGLIDSLARRRFGNAWRAEAGVIRHGPTQPALAPWVAPFDAGALELPEVRFFTAANPGYAEGDELPMIGRVDFGFVARILGRLFRRRRTALAASPLPQPSGNAPAAAWRPSP